MMIDNTLLLLEFKNLLNNVYIHIFVWIVLLDIATGIVKGLANKDGNSTKGLLGLIKHLLVIVLVSIAYPYLRVLGFGVIGDGFVLAYIAIYALSCTENWGQLGLPLPDFVKDRLTKIKDIAEKQGKDDK